MTEVQAQPKVIDIPDVKAATFKALLEFLYLDEVELNDSIAGELLYLSQNYGLDELRTGCEEFVARTLSADNFVELAKTVEQLGMESLKNSIVTFIMDNFSALEHREDLYDLPQFILIKAMSKIGSKLNFKCCTPLGKNQSNL